MLKITPNAAEKIRNFMQQEGRAGEGLRVSAYGGGCSGVQFRLEWTSKDQEMPNDEIQEVEGLRIVVDPRSVPFVTGTLLDYVQTPMGEGFRFDRPTVELPAEPPKGPVADKIRKVIDERINPGIAGHGGWVELIDLREDTAFIRLGGGCQGCGMADVTLKQGIEVMIKEEVPEIVNVWDLTDHAGGNNPYYQPRAK